MTIAANPAIHLTCSANTLRHADPSTRIRAAADAGFAGIGLRLDDCRSASGDAALRDLLDRNGVRTLELEHTWDWARPAPAAEERELYRFADEVGCRQLNVPMFTAGHNSAELIAGFAGLCDRAAARGLQVGLEFLPYSAIRTVGAARRIVAGADRPNGGLIIDLWHWFRSGAVPDDIAGLPADRITSVQLCDVLAAPPPEVRGDLAAEARHHRELPGRGSGDTLGVLAALRDAGVRAPVSVEVFSDRLDALPATEAARSAYAAAAAVLTAARWPGSAAWTTTTERARAAASHGGV